MDSDLCEGVGVGGYEWAPPFTWGPSRDKSGGVSAHTLVCVCECLWNVCMHVCVCVCT